MRRNNSFPTTVVRTRNELADAVNANQPVIDIQGETKDALVAEIEKNIKSDKNGGKLNKATLGFGIYGLLFGTLFWVPLLTVITSVVSEGLRKKADFNHYRLASFSSTYLGDKLILINTKEYNPEYDTIEGLNGYLFTNKLKCPKCGSRFRKKEFAATSNLTRCTTCYNLIVFYN